MAKQAIRGKDLQKSVIDLAHMKHWHVVHNPTIQDARGIWRTALAADSRGFPDLLCFRDRVIAIEIKGDGDTMKPEQEEWRNRCHRAGVEHYVVRPKDWLDGTVEGILA